MAGTPITPWDLTTVTTLATTDHLMLFRDGAEEDITFLNMMIQAGVVSAANQSTVKICPLDGSQKVPVANLPAGYNDSAPIGDWLIANTAPVLTDGTGTLGDTYDVVQTGTIAQGAGTLAINGDSVTSGSQIRYDGSNWYIIPSAANHFDGTVDEDTAATAGDYYQTGDVIDRALSKTPINGLRLDGVNDYVSLSDSAANSFGDGTNDKPFAVRMLVRFRDTTSHCHLAGKFTGSNREWRLYRNSSNKLILSCRDKSAGVEPSYAQDTASIVAEEWALIEAYYDGAGGAASHDNCVIRINGAVVAGTATNNASYVAMEDNSDDIRLGYDANGATYANCDIAGFTLWSRDPGAGAIDCSVPVADQWGNDTELLAQPGFESWSSASDADGWVEGGSITLAQDGVNQYAGTYCADYTSSGSAISSGSAHQLRTSGTMTTGAQYAAVKVELVSAGSFEVGINNTKMIGWDGTTLTENTAAFAAAYPGSEIYHSRSTSLGGGWYELEIWFNLQTDGRDFVLGGTGQWYIDDASSKKAGCIAAFEGRNLEAATWRDSSSNELNGTITGATRLFEPMAQASGTFTPVLQFGGGTTGITYGTQAGVWNKISESLVQFTLRITLTSKGSDTGTAEIHGMPFNFANYAMNTSVVFSATGESLASMTSAPHVKGRINTDELLLVDYGAAGSANLDDTNFQNTSTFTVHGVYEIA